MKRTLGTQLRHLIELLDGAVLRSYEAAGLNYRPRYTPIMRVLIERGSCTLGDLALAAKVTQPAATQTINLMLRDGLVVANTGKTDGRQKILMLSQEGQEMVPQLLQHWEATALAAQSIEDELPHSFTATLEMAIEALEKKSFDKRIQEGNQTLRKRHKKRST